MEKETFRLLYDHKSLQRMASIQRTQAVVVSLRDEGAAMELPPKGMLIG